MTYRRVSLLSCAAICVCLAIIARPLQAQQEKVSSDKEIKNLASTDAKVRYFAILHLKSSNTLSEPVLAMLIDYLSDLRGEYPGNTVAGAAAELLAQHPHQAVRAIPQLLELLSHTEHYGYPSESAAQALAAIGRLPVEKYVMGLSAEKRKALASTLVDLPGGTYIGWILGAELLAMLGPDASAGIQTLEKAIEISTRDEDVNPSAHVLRVRSEAALRIVRNGWKLGEPGYYQEMKRADAALGKPDPYVLPESRFVEALETLINRMKEIGLERAYILRTEETFPFHSYQGFPPAAQLILNTGYHYLYMGEDAEGRPLPNVPLVVLTTASKELYGSNYSPGINPPYSPAAPDFAFVEIGANGKGYFDLALRAIGLQEGYRQDRLYEFWPSEWWPAKGELGGGLRIREGFRALWITVAHERVVGGGFAEEK